MTISPHVALIYTMVIVSASDRDMTDAELSTMGEIVTHLPVFQGYIVDNLTHDAASCARLLQSDNSLDKVLDLILSALPEKLRETPRHSKP